MPRKELALGTDYVLALKKYAELAIPLRFTLDVKFDDALQRYLIEVVPTLSANTQHTHHSDARHVSALFSIAPLDQIRPMHIRQLLDQRPTAPAPRNQFVVAHEAKHFGFTTFERGGRWH